MARANVPYSSKVLAENCTVLSNLKTIMEEEKFVRKEGKVPTCSICYLSFVVRSCKLKHICIIRMFREFGFCEKFLWSISFLYVYDIHFGFENARRV